MCQKNKNKYMFADLYKNISIMEGHQQAAAIQADYHVMTNWEVARNSHNCEYHQCDGKAKSDIII